MRGLEDKKKTAPVVVAQEQHDMKKPMSDYEKAIRDYCKCARKADRYQFEAYICLLKVLDILADQGKVSEMELGLVSTSALAEELGKRQGVEMKIAEPYQDMQITVNGPAIVLTVVD